MQRTASIAGRITIFKTTQSYWVADFTCKSRFASTIVAINAINTVPVNAWVTCTVIKIIFTVHSCKNKKVRRITGANLTKKMTKLFPSNNQIKNPTCFEVTSTLRQLKQVMMQKHCNTKKCHLSHCMLTKYDPELVLNV